MVQPPDIDWQIASAYKSAPSPIYEVDVPFDWTPSGCVNQRKQIRRQSRDDRVFAARWLGRRSEDSLNDGYEIDVSGPLVFTAQTG